MAQLVGVQGQVKVAKNSQNTPTCSGPPSEPQTENEKRCFSISSRRLAESVDGLNSSVAQSPEELWPKECEPIYWLSRLLYAIKESVDCQLLSSFCDDSNLHISLFKHIFSTMGVSKESISNFLIGNRFHAKLRILSPENCKQSLRVKSWKTKVTAEKKQTQDYNQNFVTQAHKSLHLNKLTDVENNSGDKNSCDSWNKCLLKNWKDVYSNK